MTQPSLSAPPVANDHATLGKLVRAGEKLRLIGNGVMILPAGLSCSKMGFIGDRLSWLKNCD